MALIQLWRKQKSRSSRSLGRGGVSTCVPRFGSSKGGAPSLTVSELELGPENWVLACLDGVTPIRAVPVPGWGSQVVARV